ncbi:ankyrin repeat domain-containing protein 31 isoform X2 [Falco rusticolus]|uniref:ankyrin repeat domain-containing protein 31 isoform X2 n=1 Tax=Falco rusticolus TaxID=120794 RepID=UPI0018866997|nr:ankyrin repeat domain-containing protein 31 isoform X2 [Falco rusticolus]
MAAGAWCEGSCAAAMGEQGGGRDSDSDETIVEGSLTESDVEERELIRRRLPFNYKDMALTTEIINKGPSSPEISFIQKFCGNTYSQEEEQINPIPQEAYASDQPQPLLQGWMKHLSLTENISKSGYSLNPAVEGKQNNSVDIKLNGFQKNPEEKPVGDQQGEKEVISDYWDATSSEKQTGEGSSYSVEAAASAEIDQTTSMKEMKLRETSLRKCRDYVSSHCQIPEETQQKVPHSGGTARNTAKDFGKIQKSTSKHKQDVETILNEDRKAMQRRSKRIENKQRQEAFGRTSANLACPISLSRINRSNIYGEGLLYRAVAHEDVNLVRNIIKAGGNVNVQDYAGWTALHRASVEGFYGIANELLKAGADVNAKGSRQITPLQDAVKEGHYKVAELLLWYGADPLLKNEMGRCALEEAADPSMVRLLKSYVEKSRRGSVSDGDDSKNTLNTESVEDTNLYQISLQTGESEPTCASLMDSDSMDIVQQTNVNEVQNINTNISEDGISCTEQTLQANTETQLAHELLAATNGESVSGSPYDSTSGVISTIPQEAPQPEKGGGILLNAEGSVEACHTETENACSLDIEPMALQLHEKDMLQIRQNRGDLQDTSSKADLHFSVNAGSKSPYSFQIVENMQKETLQKTDEGVFSGGSGTEGTEENGEGNAKTSMLSQFTETEVHAKRVRLDPWETSQRAASYSSSSKNKSSSDQSQFSQASEPQKSKQSGWTAIHEASNGGFTEVILELLKAGANVNSRSMDGILPIHDAVFCNYLEAARILLQHGADPCERDGSGKSALDKACDDEMQELLKSYCAMDCVLPVETTEVPERKCSSSSRRSKSCYCYYCKNDDATLEPQHEKYNVETVAAIQCVEKEQKELLLPELRTSKHADASMQRQPQMEDTSNEILIEQKTERDTLPKKYRSSVESFKKGALRKQSDNLASRQNQEEFVQKSQNYRKTKQVFSASCSEKQIANLVSHANDKRQSLTADEIVCPEVVAFNMGLGASMPNGNRVEAPLFLENRFPAQESSRHPHSFLDETGANKEAITRKEASDHALASENSEFSLKATLLNNGKIRTSERKILQNPVQWVKDLLGSDISVTRKYVWNKVTYLGTQLSKFLVEEVPVSSDLELPSQERERLGNNFTTRDPSNHNQQHQSPGPVSIAQHLGSFDLSHIQPKTPSLPQTEVVKKLPCAERGADVTKGFKSSSVQFNSVEGLSHVLQFREIVMVRKEEFLPCSVMEKHWNFYKGCEDFGF